MNKEEILNKYIDLIDRGYCCDCNELNCIDNFPHAKITHEIRELQQQCKKQKEVIDKAVKYIDDLRDESAERQGFYNCFPDDLFIPDINELLDILKEVSE